MAPPTKSIKQGFQRESEEPETPSNNLWVGNLAADVSDSDLMGLFAKYGALDSVNTYSSRSYAFVYFKRVEDAAAAKDALQGIALHGNAIKIEFARPAKPCKQLWVGGISPAVSKEQLEEEFLKFGKIEDFKFVRDRNTAFVEYFKLEDASQAMKNMNGKRIGGDQIRVDFLRSQPPRREQVPDFRDSREIQFSVAHSGVRRVQSSQSTRGRKEGQPSNILWIGYPPSAHIDDQMLHNAMILFGEIERIKSFRDRHYSFVEFRSVDEARRAKEGLQGRLFNDPRITITYSNSELAPGKDYSFYPGAKGPRPDMFNEHPYGPGHVEMFDPHRPVGLNNLTGQVLPTGIHRPNLPLRPFGPQGGFDPVLPGPELNDLASVHSFRDGNQMPMGSNWRRLSPPSSGILPSPASRIRPPMRSVSTGWDVLDAHEYGREPKRSRIDVPLSVDDDSFPQRKIDDRLMVLDKTYGVGPGTDGNIAGHLLNVQGKSSPNIVGARPVMRGHEDHVWRGIIAKGGTPVCHARCVPIGKGIGSELPEIVNCSARTGLEMLTKHYAEAIGFDIVFFLPDSEDDFASYTEFLRYLGSKNRAGVAKFDDGTTLFLVPPSDFLSKVLKVTGPERLYGVVLKLPQQTPSSMSIRPQLRQPVHFSQHVDRHQIPPPEADLNLIPQEEHAMPVDYNRVVHEDSNLVSKAFYPPTTQSVSIPSVAQDYATNNSVAGSQAGVSLTPELIATLASLLPANAQSSAADNCQQVLGSSMRPSFSLVAPDKGTSSQGWKHDNQVSDASHLQLGNQFSSQAQVHPQLQPYSSVSNTPSHSTNVVPSSTQIQDSTTNLPNQGAILTRPLTNFAVPSQGGQYALSPQVSQQYQLEGPHNTQKGYGMVHGTDVLGSYSQSVVQQSNNPIALSSQVQSANYSQTQSGMSLSADKVNWEHPTHVQQFQTGLSGAGQGTSEVEVDKNQRYQSTLQFAASLLLQIQQKQQTNTPAAQGPGNQM